MLGRAARLLRSSRATLQSHFGSPLATRQRLLRAGAGAAVGLCGIAGVQAAYYNLAKALSNRERVPEARRIYEKIVSVQVLELCS